MKTEVFETYSEFLNRTDKKVNGVSPEFAQANPKYISDNETNEACWNCSDCSSCSYCRYCSYCSYCSSCSYCRDKKKEGDPKKIFSEESIPVIENIHQKVLQAVSKEGALDMGSWHTCDTTHCRAGWVVVLAGDKGKELESLTSTEFAAKHIYKKSSPIQVSLIEFYKSDIEAMQNIIDCAELEKQSSL